jgi:uncharacterized membrane protein
MNSITTCVKTGVIYYAIALVYALIADVFWISIVAGPMYHTTFPTLIELKLFPAALFYSSLLKTVSSSAFFGLNVYGGYALTLLAVFNFFTPIMAMLEMLWGMTIAVFVATATINTALFISPTTKKK